MIKNGILDTIGFDATLAGYSSDESLVGSVESPSNPSPANAALHIKSVRQNSTLGQLTRSASQINVPAAQPQQANFEPSTVSKLQDSYFNQMTLVAWVIRLGHVKALQYLLRRSSCFYNYSQSLDADLRYPLLHYIAVYGTGEMLDTVLNTVQAINADVTNNKIVTNAADKAFVPRVITLRYSHANNIDETPVLLACRHNNFSVGKKLAALKINLRDGFRGRYPAWALAFVKQLEQKEKNLQTGRYGDDDELAAFSYYSNDRTKNEKINKLLAVTPVVSFWY